MSTSEGKQEPESVENEWMVRPCRVYEDEYSDCTSIKARFNQYFIFGEATDCTQWKRDCDNCYRWRDDKNLKAAKEIIESEKARRKARLGPHYDNDVWEKRTAPPKNWNAPLPEHMKEEYEHSYLYLKSKELRGEAAPTPDPSGFCVIM